MTSGKSYLQLLFAWKILLRWLLAGALYYSRALWFYRWLKGTRYSIILNYHRVLDPAVCNEFMPPGMYVRPKTFEKQLRYLALHYQVVTMEQFIALRERAESTCRPLCVITFDDGWRDNFDAALPLLRKYGLPATLFISTKFIGSERTPWFYRLGYILQDLAEIPDGEGAALLSNRQDLPAALTRWFAASMVERQQNIDTMIEALKELPGAELESLVEQLQCLPLLRRQRANANDAVMLNWQQVREMAASHVEIGSHGLTHMILTRIPVEVARAELRDSKHCLEEQLGHVVQGFSYPNGNYSDEVEALTRTAGYRYACTTRPGDVKLHDNLYQLKRIPVHDDITFSTALFACHIAGIFKLL